MALPPPTKADSSISAIDASVPLSFDKLDGINYESWASDIKIWFRDQGYEEHLTQNATSIPETDRPLWITIDTQLCSILKSTLHPFLISIFHAYETCAGVWNQAKILYANNAPRLNTVCQNLARLIASRKLDCSMADYFDRIRSLLREFNELLPPASTPTQELEQREAFFMLLALNGLPVDNSVVRDQSLDSPIDPTFSSACSTLLSHPPKPSVTIGPPSTPNDSSILASQSCDNGDSGRSCSHCGKTNDRCCCPQMTTNVSANLEANTQLFPSISSATPHDPLIPDWFDWFPALDSTNLAELEEDVSNWFNKNSDENQVFNSTAYTDGKKVNKSETGTDHERQGKGIYKKSSKDQRKKKRQSYVLRSSSNSDTESLENKLNLERSESLEWLELEWLESFVQDEQDQEKSKESRQPIFSRKLKTERKGSSEAARKGKHKKSSKDRKARRKYYSYESGFGFSYPDTQYSDSGINKSKMGKDGSSEEINESKKEKDGLFEEINKSEMERDGSSEAYHALRKGKNLVSEHETLCRILLSGSSSDSDKKSSTDSDVSSSSGM